MSQSEDREPTSAADVGARVSSTVSSAVGSLQDSEAVRAAAARAAEAGQALAATLERLPPLDAVREAALATVRSAVGALPEVLEGVVEEARSRSGEAALALRGRRRPVRTWPWSAGAAVAGAAAGAGAVLLLRKVLGEDAPDAQEPESLVAVVDTPPLPAADDAGGPDLPA